MGIQLTEMTITSTAFDTLGAIPKKYTGEAEDSSPALKFDKVPEGTVELALICHDPDAPLPRGWTHWVLYNIAPDCKGLDEGSNGGFTEGVTDFGKQQYNGPMPPEGHGVHHYYFWLYALDTKIGGGPGQTRAQILEKMEGHVLGQERLVGTYKRR